MEKTLVGLTADGILVIHAGWVIFLVAGFLLVRGHPWGERAHLSALVLTLTLDLRGTPCPLTAAEIALRVQCDPATLYRGSCIAHYLRSVLPQVPWSSVQLGSEVLLVALALFWYGIPQGLRLGHLTRAA